MKLKAAAFPLILPLVRGYHVPEGNIGNDVLYKTFGRCARLLRRLGFSPQQPVCYHLRIHRKNCPVPDNACDIITYHKELPLKVLFESKHDVSGP